MRPGYMPLAHRGVLLVDDAPEMPQSAVRTLHRALEDGEARLTTRTGGFVKLPARFQLLLGAATCGCRAAYDDHKCVCPAAVRRQYPLGYLAASSGTSPYGR
ncbi:ATP-binding protein [Actinomadura sp. CNU-125]|uniref:ATP-binding protein n=1 Tax=Actinomadura sp. CNU-125 TaxID=1904961 RepID=UPI0021CCBB4F|nr:ATP-binding protein [Actinomadura sp. CNU-125]